MLKANEPIYVIMHIINIKYIIACRPTTIKEYGGLNSTSYGKGGLKFKDKGLS